MGTTGDTILCTVIDSYSIGRKLTAAKEWLAKRKVDA